MKVAVIGGSGHIGSYLTPRLVEEGHEVACVSRGRRSPYVAHPAWERVEQVCLDRSAGAFAHGIRALGAECVIDLTSYTLASTVELVEALRGSVRQFLHCGTIWVHGPATEVPTTEDQARNPVSEYGIRKAEIERYLLEEARARGFPATVLHPGHLVGVGWVPLNPAANLNPDVFADLIAGRQIELPNLGRETLHHVHCDDVAQAFAKAMENWEAACGQSFHVVSPAAVTMGGYAEAVAAWFGREARIAYLPWELWRGSASERDAKITWDHIARSPNCSIAKARERLAYEPHYTSLAALRESVEWAVTRGLIGQ